eukprot:gene13760-19664_t
MTFKAVGVERIVNLVGNKYIKFQGKAALAAVAMPGKNDLVAADLSDTPRVLNDLRESRNTAASPNRQSAASFCSNLDGSTSVLGNSRGKIPVPGSAFCRLSSRIRPNTICLSVSQSGQTFPYTQLVSSMHSCLAECTAGTSMKKSPFRGSSWVKDLGKNESDGQDINRDLATDMPSNQSSRKNYLSSSESG